MKKIIEYICLSCRKKKKTVLNSKNICPDCQRWNAPGKGQANLFGEIIK